MTTRWWGATPGSMGWAYLVYEWLYVPLCERTGVAPWGLTKLAIVMIGMGIAVNIFQIAIDMKPVLPPR